MISIHQQYLETLLELGFTGEYSFEKSDLESHATDESIFYVEPALVVYPKNTKDIQLAVQATHCTADDTRPISLTARAAGTGLSGGSLNDSVIINTTRHLVSIHSVVKNKTGALIVTDPGVMHIDLEKEMDKLQVYIPSYPASKDICTIGGMVGNNSAGPDTLRYGHTAGQVKQLHVILHDGIEYIVAPLQWDNFEAELKRDDALGEIYRHMWELLLHDEEAVLNARPQTAKNSAGYALWDVISTTVEEFMKGRGVFDLNQIFTGSQGTLGIITKITIQAIAKNENDRLLAIPIFNLDQAGSVISQLLEHKPHSVELFDKATYKAALANPGFFKQRLSGARFYKVMMSMYSTYMFSYRFKSPEFIILASIEHTDSVDVTVIGKKISKEQKVSAQCVTNKTKSEMLWQVRRASYLLSKTQSTSMRPAAFLEDMAVPPINLPAFFVDIQKLFTKYNVNAFIHGHGGNGHLHFYPLMDFTDPKTAGLIPVMAKEFFATAVKHNGNICGEHNDGIIRTPYLDMMFKPNVIEMFEKLEHVCDPNDIFNPGKKVNPKFTVAKNIRHSN